MIFIEKNPTPPKITEQVLNIKSMESWKRLSETDSQGVRNYFEQLDKSVIRNALYSEQHGLCAYCMRKIHNDETMTIEHFTPIKKSKDGALDYKNMLGCCDGGRRSDKSSKYLSCDASKSDEQIAISPFNKMQIEDLKYTSDGRILTKSGDKAIEHDLNETLHLNGILDKKGNIQHDTSTSLVWNRTKVYESYCDYMEGLERKYKDNKSKIISDIRKRIDKLENESKYVEFIGVWLYFLRRRIRACW